MGNRHSTEGNSIEDENFDVTKEDGSKLNSSKQTNGNTNNISNSVDNIIDRLNLSFRRLASLSFIGIVSNRSHSVTSQSSRPWSRVSRKRWNESTLSDPLNSSKTCWPVSHIESIFLPQFKIENCENKYTIVDFVARGAFGKVYKVVEKESGTEYALKIFSKSQIIEGNCVRQLKDEVDIQTICGHHPFIVQCLAFWQNKKQIFLLSEYISNGELFHKIRSFSYELVQLYVAEIATALDFLHNAGIIYRDLKPENILLDTNYHIKLIDFGFSKWLSIGSKTKTMCGTIQYMAPEILQGQPYGHAVDWWALGVVACRMLTNEYPNVEIPHPIDDAVQNETKIEVKYKILPDSIQNLRSESKDLLQRLLERNPQYRIRSLLSLKRIAIYKNYNWNDVKLKKVSPLEFIKNDAIIDSKSSNNHHFDGF